MNMPKNKPVSQGCESKHWKEPDKQWVGLLLCAVSALGTFILIFVLLSTEWVAQHAEELTGMIVGGTFLVGIALLVHHVAKQNCRRV